MPPVHCLLTTFNCGRQPVHIDYFASSLYNALQAGRLPPDLIVLSLQEIAPIGASFLGGSLLTPYFKRLTEAVLRATRWKYDQDATDYETLIVRNVGMTAIMILARKSIKENLAWIQEGATGTGVWEMGNKGAVGIRLALQRDGEEEIVTFVAAHLAPMEEKWERRNEDWRSICERLIFEPVPSKALGASKKSTSANDESEPLLGSEDQAEHDDGNAGEGSSEHTLYYPASYLFLAGDLNYRTSDSPPPVVNGDKSWPQPSSSADQLSAFMSTDQLTRELQAGHTLHNLAEAPITFPPTYKYSTAASSYAADVAAKHERQATPNTDESSPAIPLDQEPDKWHWATHRVPSWCDRVLYLAAAPPTVHAYTALPIQPTSDHRPVALNFTIEPTHSGSIGASPSPFPVDKNWQARRIAARRLELLVGLGAYLGLTREGQVLIGGTAVGVVFGYLALRYVLGQ